MAMRVRVVATPVPAKPNLGRHGPAFNVVSLLTASVARQEEIDRLMREPLTDEHRTVSRLRYWNAFEQIKMHAATQEAWQPLCEAINIGMLLCEDGIGAEWIDVFLKAQDFIFHASARGYRRGSYRLDGNGIAAVTAALDVHDAQLEVALRGDLAKAERTMIARIDEGNFLQAAPLAA